MGHWVKEVRVDSFKPNKQAFNEELVLILGGLNSGILLSIFMINSAEHKIFPANKYLNIYTLIFCYSVEMSMKFILLINIKMPTAVGI